MSSLTSGLGSGESLLGLGSTLRENEGFGMGDCSLETETYDLCRFIGETDLTIDEQTGRGSC